MQPNLHIKNDLDNLLLNKLNFNKVDKKFDHE